MKRVGHAGVFQYPAARCLTLLLACVLPLSAQTSSLNGVFGLRGKLAARKAREQATREIVILVSKLGDSNFHVRETCTQRLIVIGMSDKLTRNLVRDQMNRLKRNPDPEVSERAKRVLKEILPAPSLPAHLDAITVPS